MGYLDKLPSVESEMAGEIAAYEKEQAEAPKPALEPEQAAIEEAPKPEPPPVTEVKPAAAAEPEAEPDDEKAPVPYKALKEERRKRQETAQTVTALQQQLDAIMARLQQPEPQEQEAEIDETQDPIGALQSLKARLAQFEQAQQRQTTETQVNDAYVQSARSFAAQQADFPEAYRFLINSRGMELQALGYQPGQIQQILKTEEMNIAHAALTSGRNPAEVVYNTAKARGYAKAAPTQPAAAPVADAEAIAAQAAAKAAAAVSLSSGGKPPANDLSVADTANLQGKAFDDAFDKLARGAKKRSGLFRS